MKRIIICLLFSYSFHIAAIATTIVWTGPSGSNWNNAGNWSTGMVPGAPDDVVFNSAVSVELDMLPATTPFIYVINSLQVTGNATVTLTRTQAGGGMRILQVKSVSGMVRGLQIDKGSTLVVNAVNTTGTLSLILDLTGAAGVTGRISGNLFFTGTGMANGDAYLNLYSGLLNYARLVVQDGGMIKYFSNSGNTVSATGFYLTMESGALYEINKNGGSVPSGNWDDNATILITGATSNGSISFSQNQYGNLTWDTPLMSAVTQLMSPLSPVTTLSFHDLTITNTNGRELRLKTGAGSVVPPSDCTVRGNLEIAPPAIFVITGNNIINGGAGARLHVKGNLLIAGTLRSDGPAGTVNELELNGNSNQDISITGIFSGTELKFIMNNPGGATLLTPLGLPGVTPTALQLINGKIKTGTANMMSIPDNAGYTGGSTGSFIEGPIRKTGDDAFSFPVGKGEIYAPISIQPNGAMTDSTAFIAEYFRLNPQAYYGINYETPPIDHISYTEFWQLEKTGSAPVVPLIVTIPVTPYSFAKDISSLLVTRYKPAVSQWQDAGISSRTAGPSSPPYITGNISTSDVSEFGIFTLASAQPVPFNPLPVDLISFKAEKVNEERLRLIWTLSDYPATGTRFELQRAGQEGLFKTLFSGPGTKLQRTYLYEDKKPLETTGLYRLNIRQEDGRLTQSPVLTVQNGFAVKFRVSLQPNPVRSHVVLHFYTPAAFTVKITMINIAGRILKQWEYVTVAGTGSLTISTGELRPGMYNLIVSAEGRTTILQFIRL